MIQMCQRRGVTVALLAAGNADAATSMAHRMNLLLIADGDAVSAIRSKQAEGRYVAFVSDHASSMQAFDASDLGIGVIDRGTHLPARADLIAPDLTGMAAIIEGAARSENGMGGAIVLSLAANLAGAALGLQGEIGIEAASNVMYLTALRAIGWDWLVLRGGNRPDSRFTASPV